MRAESSLRCDAGHVHQSRMLTPFVRRAVGALCRLQTYVSRELPVADDRFGAPVATMLVGRRACSPVFADSSVRRCDGAFGRVRRRIVCARVRTSRHCDAVGPGDLSLSLFGDSHTTRSTAGLGTRRQLRTAEQVPARQPLVSADGSRSPAPYIAAFAVVSASGMVMVTSAAREPFVVTAAYVPMRYVPCAQAPVWYVPLSRSSTPALHGLR